MTWSVAEDFAPLLAFALAMYAVLAIPVRPGGIFNRTAKGFFGASIMCYLISTVASILGHYYPDFTAAIDPAVVSIELLWVPFIVFGVYALYSNQQLNDAISSQNAAKKAGEMLASVMDTAPAGIVVLNDAGAITFANGEARRLLDIVDEAPPSLMPSDWTVELSKDHGGGGLVRRDFHELLGRESRQGEDLLVSWPNGWHRHLVVNTAPFEDGSGRVGGAVAASIEREPWSPASVV